MLAYFNNLAIIIGVWVILGTSLNLAMGYTGLLNLGHIAFFGIGAYTSALLTLNGVPFFIAFLGSGLVAAGFGFVLSYAVKRLKGDYLALATLAFAFVFVSVALNWTALTRGPLGLPGIPKPAVLDFIIRTNTHYLMFVIAVALISVFIMHRIVSSRYGRVMEAVRDDETAAQVLGKNTSRIKYQVMIVSAFFAGLAGSLFAHYLTYIDPTSFFLVDLILILTIVIVGGLASLKGGIVAAFLVLLVPEALRFVELPSSVLGPLRQILFALLLLVILMYKPKGLFGRVDLE